MRVGGNKKIANQFVIIIGDDGAILCHYINNRLSSRIFADSIAAEEVNLFEKLMASYPKHPVTLLVDVMEQSYTQQVLPPVSSMGLVAQIERRMRRDLREEDLNSFMITGRSSDGRKDWNVLFVSLGYSEPFSKWLEFILKQANKFGGVFLLPVESIKLVQELKAQLSDVAPPEWEILLLHNKTGGFRIITFRNEKLIFARLAQNLIGESIPEVVVGNLEQELQNTFEYLKRLGFRTDNSSSKVTVVASTELLEKLDTKVLKFGEISLFSPFQVAQLTGLPESVNEKDKYSDVFLASYFAAQKKHILKFHTKATKAIENLYTGAKAVLGVLAASLVAGLIYEAGMAYDAYKVHQDLELVRSEFKKQSNNLSQGQNDLKKKEAPDTKKVVSIYNIYKLLPTGKYRLLGALSKISPEFGQDKIISSITFTDANKRPVDANGAVIIASQKSAAVPAKDQKNYNDISAFKKNEEKYSVVIDFDFMLPETKGEQLGAVSLDFLKRIKKLLPQSNVSYTKAPVAKAEQDFEFLAEQIDKKAAAITKYPAEITISVGGGVSAEGAKK